MSINFHLQIITGLWLWISCTEMTASALSSGVASPCEPRNTTVVVGSSVSFSCCFSTCTAKYLRWFWYVSRSEKDIIYSFYGEFNTKYDGIIFITFPNGLDALGGKSVLSIHRSHYNNSGRYQCTCFDNNNDEINRTMELVVIGGELKDSCYLTNSSVLENDTYEVKCILIYNATDDVQPSINCSTNTTRGITTSKNTTDIRINGKTLEYVGYSTAVLDQRVTCHLLVGYSRQQQLLQVSEWSAIPNVQFAVRDISLHSAFNDNVSVVGQGEIIYCQARGNPSPVYYWLDPSTGLESKGQQYVADWCHGNKRTVMAQKTLICVAKNNVFGNFSQVNKSVTFSLPSDADLERACLPERATLLTAVILAVLAAVVFLSVSTICIIKRKGCCQRQHSPSDDGKRKTRPQRVIREAAFVPATDTGSTEAPNQSNVGDRGRHGLRTRTPFWASTNNVANDTASSKRPRDNHTLPAVYMQSPEYSDLASVTPPIGSPPARPPRTPAMSGRMLPRLPGAAYDESLVYADVSVVHDATGTTRQRDAAARIRGVQVEPSLYAAIDHTTGSLNFKNFI